MRDKGGTPRKSSAQLGHREEEVLREIVRVSVATGEPVSSRTLAKGGRFALSPASIRNIMADLEDAGYLVQPHTSAGRVPSDLGYRYFVNELMNVKRVSPHDQELVASSLGAHETDRGAILGAAGRVLSLLSDQVAVVSTPIASAARIQGIQFVRVSERRCLALIVSEGNLVDHRLLEHDVDFNQGELDRFSKMLTGEFGGLSLVEMRERLLTAMATDKEAYDAEFARMVPLAERALEQEARAIESTVIVEGTSRILGKPEFADVDKMRRIFRAFEEKAKIVSLLAKCLGERGPTVLIGHESAFTGDMGLAVVATCYGSGDHPLGTLGVIGPRRMDYSRVIPLVEYLGAYLGGRVSR